ncbi:hypothetical protein K8I28_17235 [bacterium]|nr:hypothetical protein [bacterium]
MKIVRVSILLLILIVLVAPDISYSQLDPTIQEPAPSEDGKIGYSMNGAIGATVINGEMYQYFSLRPEISIWRFGVGLDLSFYFDSEGNIREEDWDDVGDAIDKIYYLRYGHPGDPLYLRAGSLAPVTLGYGLIMRRYTNAIEWPQVRRIGAQMEINRGPIGVEALVNNFRELDSPGLVAARATYEAKFVLPVVFGANLAYDGNQYLGAKDDDDDGVPNQLDLFMDKNDYDHIDWLYNTIGNPAVVDQLIESGDLPDIANPPDRISDKSADVTIWGVDVGVPIIRKSSLQVWLYAQMAQIAGYGRGYGVPGVNVSFGIFRAGAEYRIFEEEFLPEFFNFAYEIERVDWDAEAGAYIPKSNQLAGIPSAQGYYAEAGVNLLSLMDVFAAYQDMAYDGGTNYRSLYSRAALNTAAVPKISLAEAYMYQPNVTHVFSTESYGTVLGYRVGYALAQGLSLIFDRKTIYRGENQTHITTIETALTF